MPITGAGPSNANGSQIFDNTGVLPTYSTGNGTLTLAAACQDFFCLIGAANKVIRIRRVLIGITATTEIVVLATCVLRSTLNVGGTFTTSAFPGPYDTNDPATSATFRNYTANATTPGNFQATCGYRQFTAPTTGVLGSIAEFNYGVNGEKCPTLRDANHNFCLNLNGATVAGGNANYSVEWTESNS